MNAESPILTELTDHLISKLISYATKTDKAIGNIINLEKGLKEGIKLLSPEQQSVLVSKFITKGIFNFIFKSRFKHDKNLTETCHNILLFNTEQGVDSKLVAAFLEDYINKIENKTVHRVEEAIKSETINHQIEEDGLDSFSRNSFDNAEEILGYGSLNKEKLNLNKSEIKLLDMVWVTSTVFTEIEQCATECAKLFLFIIEKIELAFKENGKVFLKELDFLDKVERGEYYFREEYRLYPQFTFPVTSRVLNKIFKISENKIREYYRHKRKRDTSMIYQSLEEIIKFKFQDLIENALSSYTSSITPASELTLLSLNKQNKSRWKFEFDRIKSYVGEHEPKEILIAIEKLIQENMQNASIANIYFESVKLFSSINRIASLKFYVRYYASKQQDKSSNIKPLPKLISKKVFKNKSQEEEFNEILLITKNEQFLFDMLNRVSKIFEIQPKRIKINKQEISIIEERHQDTIEKLNEILDEEFELSEDVSLKLNDEPKSEKSNVTEELNLESIFSDSKSEEDINISFDSIQKEMINLFKDNNLSLTDEQVSDFAKEKCKFKGQLINSINEVFYEIENDILIEETELGFLVNNEYKSFLDKF